MTETTYPSAKLLHRRADMIVHIVGLTLILIMGSIILYKSFGRLEIPLIFAIVIYLICALASNLASCAYHFSPWHTHRILLRRIDHAAIYPSITGTLTPFFIYANTTWTMVLLWICWALTLLAMWNKITNETVKSRWSTLSYFALGALGLCAIPDLKNVPTETLWCIIGGSLSYAIGAIFYTRKSMPFRYATWHIWVNFGGIFMFIGIWLALFGSF